MSQEKRRHDRENLSLPVHYKVYDTDRLEGDLDDPTLDRLGILQDLSVGGMQLLTGYPVREKQILELELEVPGHGRVRTLAKVAWARPGSGPPRGDWRCGIQFIPVYQDDIDKIREYFGVLEEVEP